MENKIDGLMSMLSSHARQIPAFGDAAAAGRTLSADKDTIGPSSQEAQEYLRDFRCRRLPHFPFMYIPFRTSADELRSARPFLWLCIMAVSTRSTSKQAELYEEIRNIIAQMMVVELEELGAASRLACVRRVVSRMSRRHGTLLTKRAGAISRCREGHS